MTNTIVGFIVGGGLGFILGYIVAVIRDTKEEVHEVLELERKHDEAGILQHRAAFNVVFALTIVFVFYAAFASFQNGRNLEKNQQEDFVRVCQSAENIRSVQRNTVEAVYNLALGVLGSDEDRAQRPLSEEEKAATNRFIERANLFRESSYNDIHPTEDCAPFVADDHVEPPTPPFPLLK